MGDGPGKSVDSHCHSKAKDCFVVALGVQSLKDRQDLALVCRIRKLREGGREAHKATAAGVRAREAGGSSQAGRWRENRLGPAWN